jgi:hypothetical protein
MMRYRWWVFVAVLGALCAGCEAIIGFLQPRTVTVRLVNDGDFAVNVRLFFDDDQDLPRSVLTEDGTELRYTIAAGETATFARSCDDLQAVVIDDADLLIVGEIGPEADTNVLRDGDDFGCGDTIVFTFDHSNLLVDFDVSVAVQRR